MHPNRRFVERFIDAPDSTPHGALSLWGALYRTVYGRPPQNRFGIVQQLWDLFLLNLKNSCRCWFTHTSYVWNVHWTICDTGLQQFGGHFPSPFFHWSAFRELCTIVYVCWVPRKTPEASKEAQNRLQDGFKSRSSEHLLSQSQDWRIKDILRNMEAILCS